MSWNGPWLGELTDHLGYEHGDPMGHGTGNSRNGSTPKQVLTEIGAVDLDVPRGRKGLVRTQDRSQGRPASGAFQRQHRGPLRPGFVHP